MKERAQAIILRHFGLVDSAIEDLPRTNAPLPPDGRLTPHDVLDRHAIAAMAQVDFGAELGLFSAAEAEELRDWIKQRFKEKWRWVQLRD